MMITRTDWDYPDVSNGAALQYYFLRDASDAVPDAMVLQLSGTFQQVADSIKSFFIGSFSLEMMFDDYDVFIDGDNNSIHFLIDGSLVWEG